MTKVLDTEAVTWTFLQLTSAFSSVRSVRLLKTTRVCSLWPLGIPAPRLRPWVRSSVRSLFVSLPLRLPISLCSRSLFVAFYLSIIYCFYVCHSSRFLCLLIFLSSIVSISVCLCSRSLFLSFFLFYPLLSVCLSLFSLSLSVFLFFYPLLSQSVSVSVLALSFCLAFNFSIFSCLCLYVCPCSRSLILSVF